LLIMSSNHQENTFFVPPDKFLRESEQRWRVLTEALPQLVWSATPDGACDYFSTQWTEHTGVAESALLGWRWLEVLHPDDREPTRIFWMDSVAGRRPYDVEYRVRRVDGVYRWFKTRGLPIRDGEGNIFKWFGTCTDITDLKRAEEALREAKNAAESLNSELASEVRQRKQNESQLAAMFQASLDAIVTMDHEGKIASFNPAAEAIFGYAKSAAVGKPLEDLLIPQHLREQHRQGLARYLVTGSNAILDKRLELEARRADGSEFSAEFSVTRIPVEGPPLFMGYLRHHGAQTERSRSPPGQRRGEGSQPGQGRVFGQRQP
jgi:PAS domain S-box-containing protein